MQNTKVLKGRYSTYELKEVLGYGGSATVYLGVDLVTDQLVAVKKMTASDNATVQRWRAEVETLIALRDDVRGQPYVIRYLDHMQSNKTIFIVEEYASKGSLLAQLQARGAGFEEWEAARLMYQIVAALTYIHGRHIVHRDIKCANVLVCDNGKVKLSDFGVAGPGVRVGPEHAGEAGVVGSVYWMSPEMARGESLDPSSDIWSLGCLCVELLTGKPPFAHRAPANALHEVMACQTPPPLPALPLSEDCLEVLRACFTLDQDARPSAAGLLEYHWFTDAKTQDWLDRVLVAQERWQSGSAGAAASLSSAPAPPAAAAPVAAVVVSSGPSTEPAVVGAEARKRHLKALFSRPDRPRLGEWVENCLFSASPAQCVSWLEEGNLSHVIDVLECVTAEEAHTILRAFAFAAGREKREPSLFLDTLGATALWAYPHKSLTRDTPDHLGTIFTSCCAWQSVTAPCFAPSSPAALHFVLHCDHVSVQNGCVEALVQLYTGGTDPNESEARRRAVQRRFHVDGAFTVVRQKLVEGTQRAIGEGTETPHPPTTPSREWVLLDRLCQILCAIAQDEAGEGKPEDWLWEVASEENACVSGHDAGGRVGARLGAATCNPFEPAKRGAKNHPHPSHAPHAQKNNQATKKNTHAPASTSSGQVLWFLAVQEVGRRGGPYAMRLLLSLLRYLVSCEHGYLKRAGRSLVGGLLGIWYAPQAPFQLRLDAMSFLPSLQQLSPSASEFLRDTQGCVPLLAYAVKACALQEKGAVPDGLEAVLGVLVRLCNDQRMATECASMPLFFTAVGNAVRVAVLACLQQLSSSSSSLVTLAVQQLQILCQFNSRLARGCVEPAVGSALECLVQDGSKPAIETAASVARNVLLCLSDVTALQ